MDGTPPVPLVAPPRAIGGTFGGLKVPLVAPLVISIEHECCVGTLKFR